MSRPYRLLVSFLLVLATAGHLVESAVATHTLNITLSGAGNSWPSTNAALEPLAAATTTTFCGPLTNASSCTAFLMSVSTGVIGVQLSAQTASVGASSHAYTTLLGWATNTVAPPLEALRTACAAALGTALDPLTYRDGAYRMPCRDQAVYEFLPVCEPGETETAVAYVQSATGDTAAYFTALVCPEAPCANGVSVTVTAPSGSTPFTVVNITGAANALEAVLQYVSDVRAAFVTTSGSTAVPGAVGNPNAGVTATAVTLVGKGSTAELFSVHERNRTASMYTAVIQCDASTGLWAISLIVVPFVLLILLYSVWRRGRHLAKKRERAIIVKDEEMVMQGGGGGGAASAAGGAGDATLPPPGTESQVAQRWVRDEYGNYYDASSLQQDATNGGADEHSNATPRRQTYVDPETGQMFVYEEDPNAVEVDPSAAAGDGAAPQYQTYVDPETGETYQYDANATGGDEGQAQTQTQTQTYVDPETGVSYEYQVAGDAAAQGAEGGADYMDAEAAAAIQADGTGYVDAADDGSPQYQTYVDPETGENYQYETDVAAPAEGDAQYETYVDPETGETYMYDPNAVSADANN